jgi:hypothetical protein
VNSLSRIPPSLAEQPHPENPLSYWASTNSRSEPLIEAARVARYTEMDREIKWARCVEIKRTDGSCNWILTIERYLPQKRGKARLVICPRCQRPRRALYAWKLNPSRAREVFISTWQCRSCACLRYASEGGALVFHPRTYLGQLIEALEGPSTNHRPELWYPYVFTSPREAAEAGLCNLS